MSKLEENAGTLIQGIKALLKDNDVRSICEIEYNKDGTLTGIVVSSLFENVPSDKQLERFKSLLKSQMYLYKIKIPMNPLIFTYSPKEYALTKFKTHMDGYIGFLAKEQFKFKGNDICVQVQENYWDNIKFDEMENIDTSIGVIAYYEHNSFLSEIEWPLKDTYNFFEINGYSFKIKAPIKKANAYLKEGIILELSVDTRPTVEEW